MTPAEFQEYRKDWEDAGFDVLLVGLYGVNDHDEDPNSPCMGVSDSILEEDTTLYPVL